MNQEFKEFLKCVGNYLIWVGFYNLILDFPLVILLLIDYIFNFEYSLGLYSMICPPIMFCLACVLGLKESHRPLISKDYDKINK